jgi:hypothetical protein
MDSQHLNVHTFVYLVLFHTFNMMMVNLIHCTSCTLLDVLGCDHHSMCNFVAYVNSMWPPSQCNQYFYANLKTLIICVSSTEVRNLHACAILIISV